MGQVGAQAWDDGMMAALWPVCCQLWPAKGRAGPFRRHSSSSSSVSSFSDSGRCTCREASVLPHMCPGHMPLAVLGTSPPFHIQAAAVWLAKPAFKRVRLPLVRRLPLHAGGGLPAAHRQHRAAAAAVLPSDGAAGPRCGPAPQPSQVRDSERRDGAGGGQRSAELGGPCRCPVLTALTATLAWDRTSFQQTNSKRTFGMAVSGPGLVST